MNVSEGKTSWPFCFFFCFFFERLKFFFGVYEKKKKNKRKKGSFIRMTFYLSTSSGYGGRRKTEWKTLRHEYDLAGGINGCENELDWSFPPVYFWGKKNLSSRFAAKLSIRPIFVLLIWINHNRVVSFSSLDFGPNVIIIMRREKSLTYNSEKLALF